MKKIYFYIISKSKKNRSWKCYDVIIIHSSSNISASMILICIYDIGKYICTRVTSHQGKRLDQSGVVGLRFFFPRVTPLGLSGTSLKMDYVFLIKWPLEEIMAD